MGRPTLSFVTGLLGLGAAFLLFQFLLTPIALLAQIAMAEGGLSMEAFQNPDRLMASYTQELLVSNSIGQALGLAVPALLAARLHSSECGRRTCACGAWTGGFWRWPWSGSWGCSP